MKQQASQLMMQDKAADIQKKQAEVGKIQSASVLNVAKARTAGMPQAPPNPLETAQTLANINETNATAMHKRASAQSLYHKALLSPLELLADHAQQNANRIADSEHQNIDRTLEHFHRSADRAMDSHHQTRQRMMPKMPPTEE
jgi:hypothetical protein